MMKTRLMRPVVIVEYQRTAYTYPAGNVRITLDEHIGASSRISGSWTRRFHDPLLPADQHVLEVKYDEFLPDALARPFSWAVARHDLFQIRARPYRGRPSP